MPRPLPRRTAMLLGAGLLVTISGCEDTPSSTGPSGSPVKPGKSAAGTPTRDPAELAALRTAATSLQQLGSRYDAMLRKHSALRPKLSGARALHTQHLARLKTLGGVPAPVKTPVKPVPAKPAAAVSELVGTEQRLAIAHATAASARSGPAARLLASIAASQTQIAVTLGRKA